MRLASIADKVNRTALGLASLFVIPLIVAGAVTRNSRLTTTETRRQSVGLPDLGSSRAIDGIAVASYRDFWNDWKLVTVRFRKDNGEQRFVYANPLAWEALENGADGFPDGSMFGKVAFSVSDDPSFPNSSEPGRVTRIQLMQKDSKLFKETGGWGYALIVPGSRPPPDSDKSIAAACQACHQIVPERNFVFSSPAFLRQRVPNFRRVSDFRSRFHDESTVTLSQFKTSALLHALQGESLQNIRTIKSASMDLFSGSVNESAGVLARYATESGNVYALWDSTREEYAVAVPLSNTTTCVTRARVAYTAGFLAGLAPDSERTIRSRLQRIRTETLCNGVREP